MELSLRGLEGRIGRPNTAQLTMSIILVLAAVLVLKNPTQFVKSEQSSTRLIEVAGRR
jgi:hypothetical protein